MFIFNLLVQAFRLLVWGMVLAGSVILLRRGYVSAAVSMILGAAIVLVMGLLNLVMTIPMTMSMVYTSIQGAGPARVMMMAGLIATVGMFLFALGLLQLARMTKREG
jgi:cytochrome oxidase assembly protein ShyY1